MTPVAVKMGELGATNEDIAEAFQVDVSTIERWIANGDEDFCGAVRKAKDNLDARVERSLFERAMGFEHESEEIFCKGTTDDSVIRVPTRKKYAPDTTAMIFWLKNRQKEKWRDKAEVEHSGSIGTQMDAEQSKQWLIREATANPVKNPVIRKWLKECLEAIPPLEGGD